MTNTKHVFSIIFCMLTTNISNGNFIIFLFIIWSKDQIINKKIEFNMSNYLNTNR